MARGLSAPVRLVVLVVVLVIAALVPSTAAVERAAAMTSAPQLSITDVSVLEGDSATRTIAFDVTLSAPAGAPVSVGYATVNDWQHLRIGTAFGTGTVSSGADYGSVSGTLTFAAGVTKKVVAVTVLGDTTVEPDERFTVVLANPTGATLEDAYGTGTILNDDPAPKGVASAGAGDVSVRQPATGTRVVDIPVSFNAPLLAPATVTFTTRGGTAVGAGNTHASGDYVRASGSRVVPSGTISLSLPVTILADPGNTRSRTFDVAVTSSVGTLSRPMATVTVRSDSIRGPSRARHGGPPRIALFGDSITSDYTDTAKPALEALGYAVENHGMPGTGILDADQCTGTAATALRAGEDPDIVIFETVGDYGKHYPHCDPSVAWGSSAFFTEWRSAATTIASKLTAHGGQLRWMLAPQSTPGPRHDVISGINPIISNVASQTSGMATIDAFTAFGGDPPDCSLRSVGCLHLSPTGRALMTKLVLTAISHS